MQDSSLLAGFASAALPSEERFYIIFSGNAKDIFKNGYNQLNRFAVSARNADNIWRILFFLIIVLFQHSTVIYFEQIIIFSKIKIIFINFVNFFKNITFTFQKIYGTIIRIKDNIKYYLELLQLDSTKQALSVCRKQLGWIFKKILPKKFRINFHLGFEDPAVMGEVLAVWGMFYPLHQGNINIQPEFDRSVIEGEFTLKGCMSVYVFVRAACILFFDKNIKLLIKHLKRNKI